MGWERKRGMICQFNSFILTGKDEFRVNTIKNKLNIKYVITLDADTNLSLGTAKELIGAMAHILNTPVIDKRKNIVIDGHALIQPRVGVDLVSSRKSLFAKIYAGAGGTDSYTNAISDVYQDNFGEGIFTGKGIYDLELFHKILCDEIPENTVLSHDLLEGSYLRCGLATDILVLDGFPYKYSSYIARNHRWIRGDWQIAKWITNVITIRDKTKKINPLNTLSKFKILDKKTNEEKELKTKLIGRHNIVNITGAIAVADYLKVPMKKIAVKVREIQNVKHRLELLPKGNITIIDDSYNANPISSKSAVDTLGEFKGIKIIVTPGLIELGKEQEKYNYEFGKYMADICDYIFLVGTDNYEAMLKGIKEKNYDEQKVFKVNLPQEAVSQIISWNLKEEVTVLLENDLPDNYNL